MEINNNNNEENIVYYSLFDNYSIWSLETVENEPCFSRSNSHCSTASSAAGSAVGSAAGSYVSQMTQNAEQLIHSTADVSVHKKRNLIRNLEGMIEELQHKVLRLQEEVEGQDMAITLLGVKPTSTKSETGLCRCTSSAQLLVLQNKFQNLELERDHLHQEISYLHDNMDENSSRNANKKMEAENRLLQEKLKISMEKLSQVTKELMKQSCNLNSNGSKSANSELKFLLHSKSKNFKLELQDISDNQILVKNEFYELNEYMNYYLKQIESAMSKLQAKHLDSISTKHHFIIDPIQNQSDLKLPGVVQAEQKFTPTIQSQSSKIHTDQSSRTEQNPNMVQTDLSVKTNEIVANKTPKELIHRRSHKSPLTNGQHIPSNTLQTPPKSAKSPRQDSASAVNRKGSTTKLKQRSNSLQNEKSNLSLFGRSISISDVDADLARSDVVAGSDVGVCYLDILQSVIKSSESPNASLDVVTHQRNNCRGGVRVICRVRPLLANEGVVVLQSHEQVPCIVVQHKNRTKCFDMDYLLAEQSTQEDVHVTLKENALMTLRGNRGSIFSYGNTGSGKTYTMQGTPIEGGLIKRLLEDLLEHKDNNSFIVVSAIENRNDSFRDIFETDPKSRLETKTGADGSLQLLDLSELSIHSDVDLNKVVRRLQMSRQSQVSQLTHLIVQFKIIARIEDQELEIGKLSLIELACSERMEKSAVPEASKWKEVQWVSKSLALLDEVLQAVAANKPHVPFRTSKLTHFLQDCLTGEENSIDMIIQLSPGDRFAAETTASLMLAQRLRNNDSVLSGVAHATRLSGKTSPLPQELVSKPRP